MTELRRIVGALLLAFGGAQVGQVAPRCPRAALVPHRGEGGGYIAGTKNEREGINRRGLAFGHDTS